jgi:hypothetical protein
MNMFAGEGAKTADKQALKVAKDMQAAEVPDEAIHAKTELEILHDTAQRNAALPVEQGGLVGYPKLIVMPNKRFALVEGNMNLLVEHKPDGTFTISHSPRWGETGKPFTLNGDSVDDLISKAESRLQRSEAAMTAAAKSKHSKTVGGMLEMKHGNNFEYAKSARSDSQYITHTPTGVKIRISDHKLPDVYESADFEVSSALGKKEQSQSISKFLDDYIIERAKSDARIDAGGAMMHRPKTEFEILHDTAQRNAALPVEQGGLGLPKGNTAMDRANAPDMFPTDAYHGATTEIDPSFNLDYSGANALDYGKKNIWATDNPELASQYAEAGLSRNQAEAIQKLGDFNWTKKEEIPDKIAEAMFKDIKEFGSIEGGGANVLPLKLRGKQSLYDAYGGRWKNEIPKALWGRDLENADIAVINNVIDNPTLQKVDPSTVYAISNPANIRSRFAAFDPFRRYEADLLAGVGVGGMLDPQAIAEALRQQDRK